LNRFEYLAGKRVSLVFTTQKPSWQSGGRGFDPRQLHHNFFVNNHLQAAHFNPLEIATFGCTWVAFFKAL
jgi:hypothetical protein